MKPFAALSGAELQMLAELTQAHPVFSVYLSDARTATRGGASNRSALLGRDGAGAALGIAFDQLEVRTIVGRLSPGEEFAIADLPQGGELHVDRDAAARIRGRLAGRVIGVHPLQYYAIGERPAHAADPRCTPMARDDLERVGRFFASHYPETIFSPWMLDRLFLGIVENGELVACGGVVAAAEGICNIGNFLTAPRHRGRGLCRAIASSLVHRLFDQGISQVTLGTTQDNPAACRAYEASGFACFDRRLQLDVSAASDVHSER
ncbi:MAG TPA: GNAT family N-acetyltransferase [Rhodopseudomonas sp.]|uniref:GNAT family N-acetyltransferase n=1 Tax=Rhodopseudomonas sp. TaxID=1078 RepID=UPI002ED95815